MNAVKSRIVLFCLLLVRRWLTTTAFVASNRTPVSVQTDSSTERFMSTSTRSTTDTGSSTNTPYTPPSPYPSEHPHAALYEILELNHLGAQRITPSIIKQAYRRLAKRYHPDVSGGDATQFAQLSHAYEFLTGQIPGKDLRFDLPVTHQKVALGGKTLLRLDRMETCQSCRGQGMVVMSRNAPWCGDGTVQEHIMRPCLCCQTEDVTKNAHPGNSGAKTDCPVCGGTGFWQEAVSCVNCQGEGTVLQKDVQVIVDLPALGNRYQESYEVVAHGEGHAGPRGGPSGDLHVICQVKPLGRPRGRQTSYRRPNLSM